jgi:hypothetical protein
MALTRPTIYNLNTNIEVFNDSITVLNAAASLPTTDVGFVFNRAHGLVANAAVYWSESAQSFVYALTNSNGAPNSNIAVQSYGNVLAGNVYTQNLITTGSGYGNIYNVSTITANTVSAANFIYTSNGASILGTINSAIGSLQSNLAGYYLYANANVAGLYNSILGANTVISSLQSNVAGYYVYANANVGSLQNQITNVIATANANIAAYLSTFTGNIQVGNLSVLGNITTVNYETILYTETANVIQANSYIYPNGVSILSSVTSAITGANTAISALQSNIAGYYTWANANVAGLSNSILGANTAISALQSNIAGYYNWANANTASLQTQITNVVTTANANTVAYLASSSGNLSIGANIVSGNVFAPAYFYSNGTPFSSSNYGNVQMLANLASATNPITIGSNLTVGGNLTIVGNLSILGNINTVNYETVLYTETANVLNVNTLSVSGNITSGNLITGNIYGQYIVTTSTGYGNIYNVNTLTANTVSTGNVVVGGNLTITGSTGFFARPVRQDPTNITVPTYYNPTTNEFTYQPGYNTISSVSTGATVLDSFSNVAYRTVKYTISTWDVINNQSQSAEIILAQDGNNVSISSYGVVYTGPSQKMTFQANITSSTVQLWGTGTSANNTVRISRIVIPF